uniref:Uncharacterized protein n=1 Tax=Rhizophora mucronata TaxID=61149 RepID=A0A2P2QL26_RHIMU
MNLISMHMRPPHVGRGALDLVFYLIPIMP